MFAWHVDQEHEDKPLRMSGDGIAQLIFRFLVMRRKLAAFILVGFLVGCRSPVSPSDVGWYWQSYESLEWKHWNSESERRESVRVWNDAAGDLSNGRELRAAAISNLFRFHVRPGFNSAKCKDVIGSAKWLDQVVIEPQGLIGGYVPLDLMPAGLSVFRLLLPRDENEPDPWCIYFSLSGLKPEDYSPEKALDFFKGKLDGPVRLHEFALCHRYQRQRKTERFSARGAGLTVH